MRARLVDPKGPLWTRIVPPAVVVMLVAAGYFFDGPGERVIQTVMFVMGLGLALGRALFGNHSPREAEITLGPGYVDVKGAGLLNQRISGRKVKGASTAYLAREGVGLVLQRRGEPIELELRDEADAGAVRDALGIGHHGFGKISWYTVVYAINMLLPIFLVPLVGLSIFSAETGSFFSVFESMMLIFASVMFLSTAHHRRRGQPVGIELEARGVVLREPRCEIPYGAILDVQATKDGILIVTDPRFHQGPIQTRTRWALTNDERAHCIAQITSAVRRARGLGPREPLVSGQIEDLARRTDDTRAWLLRLDAIAQQMMSSAGYRGLAVDSTEL